MHCAAYRLHFPVPNTAGFSAAAQTRTGAFCEIKVGADFIIENITNPQVGTIGVMWAVWTGKMQPYGSDVFITVILPLWSKLMTDKKGMLGATSYT
jgi:uncharacterized membrane protein